MKFTEIIPLVRLPRSLEVFDYQIPDELVGQLAVGASVLVPFRGKTVTGIVVGIKSESTFAKTTVRAILDARPLVDGSTLSLLRAFAADAYVSPALFLRYALPEVPRRKKTITQHEALAPPEILTEMPAVTAIRFDDAAVIRERLITMAQEAERAGYSLLILFPTQERARACATFLKAQKIPVTLNLPTDARVRAYELWHAFRNREVRIIVGTPGALFFPLPRGGRYVLMDESAEEWKQSEINPRIDVRLLLPKLANQRKASVLIFTPQFALSTPGAGRTITDVRIHRAPPPTVIRAIPGEPFTPALEAAMAGARGALFFVHRKGDAAVLRCRDCGYTARCMACELILAVHRSFLRCTACSSKTPLPLHCPSCNGPELAQYGVGSERIAQLAAAQFSTCKTTVTTSAFLHEWPSFEDSPKYDVVAAIECDTMLYRPDFRSQEKLGRIVNGLSQRATQCGASFFIQTQFPELPVWRAGGPDEESWTAAALEERRTLHYPPFYRMAKLVFQHPDQKQAHGQAAAIRAELTKRLPKEVECTGPYDAKPPRVRGQYRELLLLRFFPAVFSQVRPHLTALPDSVIVDLDPSDILR